MRIILRDEKNEVVLDEPAPETWKEQAYDIIRWRGVSYGLLGQQDEVRTYCLAKVAVWPWWKNPAAQSKTVDASSQDQTTVKG